MFVDDSGKRILGIGNFGVELFESFTVLIEGDCGLDKTRGPLAFEESGRRILGIGDFGTGFFESAPVELIEDD